MGLWLDVTQIPDNAIFGHYRVGDQTFDLKIPALLSASKSGITPTWHYHRDVYQLQDWQGPIKRSLEDLYQSRARQLRAKYDYLVLSFSGGSDSWTALDAFRTSGTHLDEVLVRWPKNATQNLYTADPNNRHPSNILTEWDLAIAPVLTTLQQQMPKTKITVVDWSENIVRTELSDQSWIDRIPQDYLNVGAGLKWTVISDTERKHIDKGLKTCFISGIDKPQLFIDDGKVYCYFLDKLANGFYNANLARDQGRNCEHFYWTPDMPEITVEQSKHIFLNLKFAPHMRELIDRNKPYDSNKKKIWNAWTRAVIYPKYSSLNMFQADKSYTNVLDEVDNWMSIYRDTRYVQSWNWGLKNVFSSIAPKFIQKKQEEITGFVGFSDGEYLLGEIDV